MAINFPNTPAIGDTYYAPSSGVTYRWDGTMWLAYPSAGPGYGPSGDFCATLTGGSQAGPTSTWTTLLPPAIVSGNAGSWYNPATGVYRPPPGRYFIIGSFSSYYGPGAMNFAGQLRKNGVAVTINYMTSGAANWQAEITCEMVIDANGSDTFDFQGQCIGAVGYFNSIMFLAYPIAGAKGPPGDKGATGDVGTLASLHLHENAEVTTGTPAQLAVTIPLNAKKIEFGFYAECSTAVDATLMFQWMQGATPLASANYYGQYMYGQASAVGTAVHNALTGWQLGGLQYWGGTIHAYMTNSPSITNFYDATVFGSGTGGGRYVWSQSGFSLIPNSQITGFRMIYTGGQLFKLGSFLKCFSIN